jgi:hypothetical protein
VQVTSVLAAEFLAGSLLAMLVPIATLVALLVWGVLLIRRHERRRAATEAGDGSAARGQERGGSPSAGAG